MDATTPQVEERGEPFDPPAGNDEHPAEAAIGEPSVDGRSLRRERNREAVIVSLLELIREGNLDPATTDIADRAGVSHRSVFRYFDDLDDLVSQAFDHAVADAIPLATLPSPAAGSVEQRIETLIESRLQVFNHTELVLRVARSRALSIPTIEGRLAGIAKMFRGQMAELFEPELSQVEPDRRDDAIDALMTIVSYEAFDYVRRRLGRDDDALRSIWRLALTALVAA